MNQTLGRPRIWHNQTAVLGTVKIPIDLLESARQAPDEGQTLSMWLADLVITALGLDPLDYREPLPAEGIPAHVQQRRDEAELERLLQAKAEQDAKARNTALSIYMTMWNRGAQDDEFRGIGLEPPSYPEWPEHREILLQHRLNWVRTKNRLDPLPDLPAKPTHPGVPEVPAAIPVVSAAKPSNLHNDQEGV